MNTILINILAGCATQACISLLLWHRNLLSLPKRVDRIENDIAEIKSDLKILLPLPERVRRLEMDIAEVKDSQKEFFKLMMSMNGRLDKIIDKN